MEEWKNMENEFIQNYIWWDTNISFSKTIKKSAIVRKVTKPIINFSAIFTKPIYHQKDVKQHIYYKEDINGAYKYLSHTIFHVVFTIYH